MLDSYNERPSLTRGLAWWLALPMVLIALVLLCQPSTGIIWHEGAIEETGSWSEDDWAGGPYTMEYSYDGSMVMLVGYGGPDEVRIMDRNMTLLGKWEPTEPNLSVEGAYWSDSDERITVWGTNGTEENDTLLILSVPGFEPMDGINLTTDNTLVDITSARLVAYDVIIAIGGRTSEGASRLQVFEVETSHLLNDIGWKENATIVVLDSDGIDLVVIDDMGFIANIETMGWTPGTRWEGSGAPPSASCIGEFVLDRIWIIGYEDGKVRLWGELPRDLISEADTGDGPVLGVASLFFAPRYYAVAVPQGSGGSRITGWIHSGTWGEWEWSNVIEASARVLSMDTDPQVAGQFLAAFDDGTIASYRTSIIPNMEPEINITAPPGNVEWKGVMTVEGEVIDEVGRVDWVRYSIDGGEWMDANGTNEFTFDVDADAFGPGDHVIAIQTFDGVHDYEILYGFFIVDPPEDDEGEDFWFWFTGCTSMIVVFLIVMYYVLTGRKRSSAKAREGKEGSED